MALLLCVLACSTAQAQFYRKLEYFLDNDAYARAFSPATDGGLLLLGTRLVGSTGEWHVVKTTPLGDVEWAARYGPTMPHLQPVAMPLPTGGHLLVGYLLFSSYGWTSLLQIDADGAFVSQRAIGKPGYLPMAFRPITLANGDLLIADFAFPGYALTRLSPTYDVLWSHTRAMGNTMSWVDIADPRADAYETPEGDIVACGAVVAGNATMDAVVMKVSANGDLIWHCSLGAAGGDGFRWILPTSDGGVLALGTLNSVGFPQILMVRLATDGAVLWQKTFGGGQIYRDAFLLALTSGRYLVGASMSQPGADASRPLVFEVNEAGTLIWAEEYAAGESLKDGRITADGIDMLGLKQAPDGDFNPTLRKFTDIKEHCEEALPHALTVTDVFLSTTQPLILSAGKTVGEPTLVQEALTVPFMELCFRSTVHESGAAAERISVGPNPVNEYCALYGAEGMLVQQLLLYDALGRFIADLTAQAHHEIDVRFLQPGQYSFWLTFANGATQAVRFVVAKP